MGDEITAHSDVGYKRHTAFIYYLTPDNYDVNAYGGVLEADGVEIVPEFNSLVWWNMPGPLHRVTRVLSPDANRIALVGFRLTR